MSLNIKNEETCRLAGELAQLIGKTKTRAITEALREKLERELHAQGTQERLVEMRRIANQFASLLGDGPAAIEHGSFLYDEKGLPK